MNSFQSRLKATLLALIGVGLLAAAFVAQAGDVVTYVLTDTLGNPVTKTDSTGAVILAPELHALRANLSPR